MAWNFRLMNASNWSTRIWAVILLGAGTVIASPAQTLTTLVNFDGTNGDTPEFGALVQGTDGNFYGTTYGTEFTGFTVFKMTPAGALTTLHTFTPTFPGTAPGPNSSLVQASDGNFYGTSLGNGINNAGTIFRISPNGTFATLYDQFSLAIGDQPNPALIQATDGSLYGTTIGGSLPDLGGTVFKITLGGMLTTIHTFTSSMAFPAAGLIQATDGNFYGTTSLADFGGGAIFKMTPGGLVTLMHTFDYYAEGITPNAPLTQGADGNLYGILSGGYCSIFKITLAGSFTLLHSFAGTISDGCTPDHAGLVQAPDGNFYGTTSLGGVNNIGTIFKITPGGTFTLVHSFAATDGQLPRGGLTLGKDGNLYGTTSAGGTGFRGTVFKLALAGGGGPPPPPAAPAITGIVNDATYTHGAPVASGSWVGIFGSNLAPAGDSRGWNPSTEIVNGKLPTSLDGTSVTVNGKPAAIAFISPNQVNIQPPDDGAVGSVQVVVTTPAGAGAPFTASYAQFAPGFFEATDTYLAAQHADGSPVGGQSGATPAKPGEVIILWGTGFGPASPAVSAGQVFTGANKLANAVTVTIGGQPAVVDFAGIVGAGLVQMNVHVPSSINNGDAAVVATVGGVATQATNNLIAVGMSAGNTASAVVPSVVPNPVYQGKTDADGYSWFFTVKLTETAGVATTLSGFTYTVAGFAAQDLSSSIPALFGSAAIPAKGTLSSALRTQLSAPANVTLGFSGADANGTKWTQQIVVPFLGMQ
jgi:uncharacterized protein (TIGR03437 family)